jgi:hypothetical protein
MVNRHRRRRQRRLRNLISTVVVATHMRIETGSIRRRWAASPAVGRDSGVFLKFFLVARFRDSESATRVFCRACFSRAMHRILAREFCCIQEMPVPQGFLAHLTRHCLRFLRASLCKDSRSRAHRIDRAEQVRRRSHQHFLKRHSGFFISLVYSNCSASRIAGCTTLTSHLTL